MVSALRHLLGGTDKRPGMTREQSLKGVPVKTPGITCEQGPDGECMIFIPHAQSFPRLARWLGAPQDLPARRLILDDLGNRVWASIDGRRNVAGIVRLFARDTGLHPREAEVGVVDFLGTLMRRGLISIAFKAGKQ